MFSQTFKKASFSVFLPAVLMLAFDAALAQNEEQHRPPSSTDVVTASATAERVRFAAPNIVVQLRLEVYSELGQKIFDTELHGGNVLDWHLQNGQAERPSDSAYLCVVTIKNLSGKLTQKLGRVTIANGQPAVEPMQSGKLTAQQTQAVGPIDEDASIAVVAASEGKSATVITNDGQDGQITRSGGALSFRLGDFFSGADKEQMRLTEEGNLGIGTAKPKVKLDVAGMIRAREGFAFSDGSKLNVNEKGVLTLTNSNGTIAPNVAGTGTQNRLAKWTDSSGTLGDSVAIDTGTGLQLTAPPSSTVDTNLLYLNATNGTTGVLAGSTPSYGAANGPFFAMRGNTYSTIANQRGMFTIAAGNVAGPVGDDGSVKFNTGSDQLRMVIRASGNVGIGTPAPTAVLDVVGDVNTSTQYNIGGLRVLTISGDSVFPNSNLFAGVAAGQGNNSGVRNSFFGFNAGKQNTQGSANSFFGNAAGQSNTDGGGNSFFGIQAGLLNTLGSDNSFFGSGAGRSNTGSANSFFGKAAGTNNDQGVSNVFVGHSAGNSNRDGNTNTFLGAFSGLQNTHESNNTFIGYFADGAVGITNATAIGAGASVTQSNSLVLGATADTKVGIGTTAPAFKLEVVDSSSTGLRVQTNAAGGTVASFGDNGDFKIASHGIFGARFIVKETGDVGIGTALPAHKLEVFGGGFGANALIGDNNATATTLDLGNTSTGGKTWRLQSVGGNVTDRVGNFEIWDSGTGFNVFTVQPGGNVGIGTTNPTHRLEVNGSVAGVGAYQNISDVRFKKNIYPLSGALNKILHLRGVSFDWRRDEFPSFNFSNGRQVGFIAQEMAAVLPEAVTRDDKGYYRMAYSEVTPVLVEAIKEQQQEIQDQQLTVKQQQAQLAQQQEEIRQQSERNARQQRRLTQQQQQIEGLKKLTCLDHPRAQLCKQ